MKYIFVMRTILSLFVAFLFFVAGCGPDEGSPESQTQESDEIEDVVEEIKYECDDGGKEAATIEVTFGEGFYDKTPLTEYQKEVFVKLGRNEAKTIGEARRNAFTCAVNVIANKLAPDYKIGIAMTFLDDTTSVCRREETFGCVFPPNVLVPIKQMRRDYSQLAAKGVTHLRVPTWLVEELSTRSLTPEEKKLKIKIFLSDDCFVFGERKEGCYFYYGIVPYQHYWHSPDSPRFGSNRSPLALEFWESYNRAVENGVEHEVKIGRDFIGIALHEILHGLGIHTRHFAPQHILWTPTLTLYDLQLYSEQYQDFVINIRSASARRKIFTHSPDPSELGKYPREEDFVLSYDGTYGGTSCSYGRHLAKFHNWIEDSFSCSYGINNPHPFPKGFQNKLFLRPNQPDHYGFLTRDVMAESHVPFPRDMEVSMGILKDLGWRVEYEDFPHSCENSPEIPESEVPEFCENNFQENAGEKFKRDQGPQESLGSFQSYVSSCQH